MKTAVSIPDDLFRLAEAEIRRRRLSRSALYAEALRDHLSRGEGDRITAKLDQVYGAATGNDAATEYAVDPVLAALQDHAPLDEWT